MNALSPTDATTQHTSAHARGVRILHVVASLQPGGMERTLSRLLSAFAKDDEGPGMQHGLAILGAADPALVRESAQVARIFQIGRPRRWGQSVYWLRRVVRAFEPQLVHARASGSWFDAMLATRGLTDVRCVLGFHGRENLDEPSWRRRLMLAWAARRADAIVTLSQESAGWIHLITSVPRSRITVAPNGVDIERFQPATSSQRAAGRDALLAPRHRFLVACVANLMPIKGIDVLLAAWRRVAMVVPDAQLIVAGEGQERANLQRDLEALRLADKVRLAGSSVDICRLLHAADLFVLPSRYECCSNALLEAMACGLASVATAAGGNPELISPNRTGWLVRPGCSPALSEAIIAPLLNSAARQRVGQAARAYVSEHHRLEAMTRRYRDLYQRLAGDDARPTARDEELCPCVG